ncbi:MAG: asparagine--tRNA ligase [Planctomycetaceae bacterium]|nr:asparagine--tRNA ligase [Planctomycetaceae bacterium]
MYRRIADLLKNASPGDAAEIRGWVRTRRDSKGGFSFVEVNDGSCFASLQAVVPADVPGYEQSIKDVTTGSSVAISGKLVDSPGKGQRLELQADALRLLGTADADAYPLQKKRHSFEFLREIAHLRTRTNTFGAVFRVRNRVSYAIHEFFQQRGFLYVHSPIITTSDCEGAGAMFRVTASRESRDESREQDSPSMTSLNLLPSTLDPAEFFGRPAYLTVSGQLEGEIFACSLGPCYTFGPTFRAENSNTTRHLAEFWMIEPEMPFFELIDNMALAEEFIRHLCRTVLEDCQEDLAFFADRIDKEAITTLRMIAENDFLRVTYTEAVEVLTQSGMTFDYQVEWGRDLQSEHERYLTEQHFQRPVILYDYPRTIKPFYMRVNDDGKTVRAMDVLVPRVGEIIGGSQREERLDVLESRMREQDLDPAHYWWYCELRKYGTVPHSGFGLGLERLMLLITGMQNIRDVIPFPRTPKSAEF